MEAGCPEDSQGHVLNDTVAVTNIESLSVAAPAYNEAESVGTVVESWATYLAARFAPGLHEIVICDDGSEDATGEILRALAARHPSIKICAHSANQGAAAAISTAIANTSHAWVLLLDSDGQFPIENLDLFAGARADSPAPAYIGFRSAKADRAFARFGSWGSGQICNLFHGTRYRDFNCALKLVEGRLLRSLPLEAKGLNYSTEITSRLLERGVEMRELQVLHQPRLRGRSSRSLLRGSLHRGLFVAYIGFRQLLLRWSVLQRQPYLP
jgi:glycosyltransferase involved in cell wall biosynthesis